MFGWAGNGRDQGPIPVDQPGVGRIPAHARIGVRLSPCEILSRPTGCFPRVIGREIFSFSGGEEKTLSRACNAAAAQREGALLRRGWRGAARRGATRTQRQQHTLSVGSCLLRWPPSPRRGGGRHRITPPHHGAVEALLLSQGEAGGHGCSNSFKCSFFHWFLDLFFLPVDLSPGFPPPLVLKEEELN
ncbi:hypothetical protein DAI22_04g188400 [Oryza sativa Japonica Group]|nr:hypothetical protein DAI22_04g188400 [Oryza sativa Japonica Group]KAF2934791.1 hypothetical protein DAI22_04g188400 [Oryza sativa Japonica Group]KAF2934793.1 hypothetical protein DAI22_04g188400 [Oryza sativa Japonica Group]